MLTIHEIKLQTQTTLPNILKINNVYPLGEVTMHFNDRQ
jgi:hypothetical protein